MLVIEIYRGGALLIAAKPNDSSTVKEEIMGENTLTLQLDLDRQINFNIGDYTDVLGTRYYIHAKNPPVETKKSLYLYEYDITMKSAQYLLQNTKYLFLGDDNSLSQPNFSLYGTADTFIDLLLQNAARCGIAWRKGGVMQTEYKNLTFNAQDCLSALQAIAEAFETEWYLDGVTINLAKCMIPTNYSFSYGKAKGLYSIKRSPADNANLITRLYVFGGTQNIPANYRNGSDRLLLPASGNPSLVSDVSYNVVDNHNGMYSITFFFTPPTDPNVSIIVLNMRNTTSADPRFVPKYIRPDQNTDFETLFAGIYEMYFESMSGPYTDYVSIARTASIMVGSTSSPYALLPGTPTAFIEHNTSLYGDIEEVLTFDDIYPHRTGIITGVDAANQYKFTDSTMDFDVNQQLLPGTPARVQFNTGQLAGYSFKIAAYNPTTKEFTINKNDEEKSLDIPSLLLRPAIGDEYVLIDLYMPQSYISAAETLLLLKAQDYLNTYSTPVYSYTIECDPKYFRLNLIKLKAGNIVTINDLELEISRAIRVLSVVKPLTDEYKYSITLGEAVAPGVLATIQSSLVSNSNSISNIANTLQGNKMLAGVNVGDLKIEQGTLVAPDIPAASSTNGMQQLYIDAQGKVWKH